MPYAGNPNSANQTWSRWTFTVRPGDVRKANPLKEAFALRCANFATAMWGHAGQMRIESQWTPQNILIWKVHCRLEGAPVQDPAYRDRCLREWARFFSDGFGAGTHTHMDTKLEAGNPENGQPREQLIIMPSLPLPTAVH